MRRHPPGPVAAPAAALRFEAVDFSYAGGPCVFEGLDFSVPRGGLTALLGPNGVGKSTLMSLAIGWLRPEGGRVLLDGRPLAGMSRREMGRTAALVPQSEHIPFEYTVLEYVLLGRAPHLHPLQLPDAEECAVAERCLDRVGIGSLAGRSVTELSAGERQLATLARALAQEPRVLLMDEPSSHLDLANRARLASLLRMLVDQGVTVLAATHDPQMAAAAADTVALLGAGGRLLDVGPPEHALSSESLSSLYGSPVRVYRTEGGPAVLWGESKR